MSYLTDPHQLAQLPTVEQEELEDEPPTPEEIFHGSFRHYPDSVSHSYGIHTDVCRFDEKGNHTDMAEKCPHFDEQDEEGRRVNPGWTVQQR